MNISERKVLAAKRLKASAGISKSAPRSEEPEPPAKTLTLSVVDVASCNVNYAAVIDDFICFNDRIDRLK